METTRTPPQEPPLLLNFRDAAVFLGVGKTYIYEKVDAGEIAYVELGSEKRARRRITREALNDFIQSRTEQA